MRENDKAVVYNIIFKIILILFFVFSVFTHQIIAQELSFLKKNPELYKKLKQWELDAPEEVKKEIDNLRKNDPVVKTNAVIALRFKKPFTKGAILVLMETFTNNLYLIWKQDKGITNSYATSSLIKEEAVKTIAGIGTPAVEPLLAALKDEDHAVRNLAAQSLGIIKDTLSVEPLISVMKDTYNIVRISAVEALGNIDDPRVVEPLITALKDKDNNVRGEAVLALGRIKDTLAVEPLILVLKDVDYINRRLTVEALSKINDPRAVEPLITALNDKKVDVQKAAAKALGKMKDIRAVEPLIEMLKDKNDFVDYYVVTSLRNITNEDFGRDYKKWKDWWHKQKENKK